MSTSDDLSLLFQAERAVRPPNAAAQQGWTRLAADLAANVAPLPVAVGPLKFGLWLVPKWILAGFALGLLGAGAVAPLLAPRAVLGSAGRTRAHVLASKSVAPRAIPAAEENQPASLAAATEQRVSAETRLAASPSALPSAASAATFDAELKLISLAKADLDAHRPTHALAWLSEHAARFPNGVFVTEREALDVLARCEQGPPNVALAKRFAEAHPSSPLVARLMKACGAVAPSTPDVGVPVSSAHAGFATLPNGSGALGEPTNEPSGGTQR
jgi:hypothetical protein